MNYDDNIDYILKEELTGLINKVREKKEAFQKDAVEKYCRLYDRLKKY